MNEMNYELAKKLKDAGFPQKEIFFGKNTIAPYGELPCYIPTLSELIEVCGEEFEELVNLKDKWISYGGGKDIIKGVEQWHAFGEGSTPEEAVARLWLELNKKKYE